jgi:hypothetical protein
LSRTCTVEPWPLHVYHHSYRAWVTSLDTTVFSFAGNALDNAYSRWPGCGVWPVSRSGKNIMFHIPSGRPCQPLHLSIRPKSKCMSNSMWFALMLNVTWPCARRHNVPVFQRIPPQELAHLNTTTSASHSIPTKKCASLSQHSSLYPRMPSTAVSMASQVMELYGAGHRRVDDSLVLMADCR